MTKSWNAHHHPLDPPLFRIWNQEVYDLAVQALIESNILQLNDSEGGDAIDLSRQCHFFLRPFVRYVAFEFRDWNLYKEKADVMNLLDIVKGCPGITSMELQVSSLGHADCGCCSSRGHVHCGSCCARGFYQGPLYTLKRTVIYYPMPPPACLIRHLGFDRILHESSMQGKVRTLFLNLNREHGAQYILRP